MNTKKNIFSTIVLQFITILAGLILPRLIISTFGSEVNGLISSITQYLSIISIVEGGLGAVVLSELYKPIENKNMPQIMGIYRTTQTFFKHIAVIFALYSIILSFIYPLISNGSFDYSYICTLVLILSIGTFVQYFFSITNRLIIEANQDLYLCNYISALSTVLNLIVTVVLINLYPNIHIVKFFSALVFLIHPICFSIYVRKKEYISKATDEKRVILKNRWSGFAQNLAHFINMNTDIIIITCFLNLKEVSVYSVYCMASNQLKSFVSRVASAYQSALGKYVAIGDNKKLLKEFDKYSIVIHFFSTILISSCILLNTQFVQLYTIGVKDADYYRPIFTVLMGWVQFIFCIREPYRYIILSAGKFKETNSGSFIEAGLNMLITLLLIKPFGITGAAVGTLVAITYRLIYFILYVHKDILFLRYKYIFKQLIAPFIIMFITSFVALFIPISIDSFFKFIIVGAISAFTVTGVYLLLLLIINKHDAKTLIDLLVVNRKR